MNFEEWVTENSWLTIPPKQKPLWALFWKAAQENMPPIDVILHCPACGMQHIDRPGDHRYYNDTPEAKAAREQIGIDWPNKQHRSHLCHGCGHIWRPADVPTNGVAAIKTKGKDDSPALTKSAPAESALVQALYDCITDSPYGAGVGAPNRVIDINTMVCNALRAAGYDTARATPQRRSTPAEQPAPAGCEQQ